MPAGPAAARRIYSRFIMGKETPRVNKEGTIFSQFARYVSLNVLEHGGAVLLYFGGYLFYFRGVGSNGIAALNLALPAYSLRQRHRLMVGMGGAPGIPFCGARAGRTRPTRCSLTLREWRRF